MIIQKIAKLLIITGGALALFTSCTVGPDYVRPTAMAPSAYKEADGWKVAQPKDNCIRGAWWEIFNDPQLSALEEQVNISNQNIIAAEAQFREARALVQQARAGYFPTVTAGASFTRTRSKVASGTGSSSGVSDYQLPVDVSWEPDVWGRVRRTVEASQANAQASAADLGATQLSVQGELAQDYFQLRTLDAQRQLLDATVINYRKSLDLTKYLYAQGVDSSADVLQAETQLKTTEAQAIDVGVQRAQMEHAIALLAGKPASDFSIPVAPLSAVPPAIPVGMPSELLERRPDIAAAERLAASANAQIGVAESAFYPNITLSASGGFASSDISKWLTWPSRFWAIGSAISETVFDAGLRHAMTEQARAAYDASVASYRQAVLTGFQEVEDNLAALRILEQEARVQDEAVKAARQSVALITNQYKAGTVSYLNVIVAQSAELANQNTAINILGRRMSASVLLIKALGGGWNKL
ncbi:MAG: efflux transporter outer membrane subunit [Dissulfurispiraceae bacterium]|jgi:NodT family efflux transporter outer membrane factor (OMF) lipoprotein